MTKADRVLLCSCNRSMSTDTDLARTATGAEDVRQCHALCTADLELAEDAMSKEGVTVIACA